MPPIVGSKMTASTIATWFGTGAILGYLLTGMTSHNTGLLLGSLVSKLSLAKTGGSSRLVPINMQCLGQGNCSRGQAAG